MDDVIEVEVPRNVVSHKLCSMMTFKNLPLTTLARIAILHNILYIKYESIVGTARGTSTPVLTWLKIKLS